MASTSRLQERRPPENPLKKIKMLKRRLQTQQQIISSLEQRNYNLVAELNDTKISLTNMTAEYNKLMSKNYEQAVTINHNQEEFIKHKNFYDSEVLAALKPLGCASEILINLKNKLSRSSSGCKTETVAAPPSVSTINETNIHAIPSDPKRNQAAVSPMVHGYVIGNPTISLQRLRLGPAELSAATRERAQTETINTLSPIQEEQPPTEPVRTRLGSRTVPPQNPGNGPRLSDYIPDAHSEPVVRLSDVSRLLSNTSWLNVNFSPNNENAAESSSAKTTPSPSSSFSPKTGNVTVRLRKKTKNLQSNNTGADGRFPSSAPDLNVENGNITVTECTSIPAVSSSQANISSGLSKPEGTDEVHAENSQSVSQPQELSQNENNIRSRSKRVRRPSRRFLEAESTVSGRSEVKSQRNSKISVEMSTTQRRSSIMDPMQDNRSKQGEDVTLGEERRTSKRRKKQIIKYFDEPLTSAEMQKILKKGLRRKSKDKK